MKTKDLKPVATNPDANGFPGPWPPAGPPDPEEVSVCKAFLGRCERTKIPRVGSYGLKHIIERWAGKYVSNGACIQAALDLGLVVRPYGPGNPNARLGVSRRSVLGVATEGPRHAA